MSVDVYVYLHVYVYVYLYVYVNVYAYAENGPKWPRTTGGSPPNLVPVRV